MNLSAAEIGRVVAAAKPHGEGALLSDVRQPGRDRIVLELRRPGSTMFLLICVASRTSRLHLVTRPKGTGHQAGSLCLAARRNLRGKRLERIEQLGGDRAVALRFGEAGHLVAELTGPHSNLFVLNARERIVASLRTDRSRARRNQPGERYTPLGRMAEKAPNRQRQLRFDAEDALPGGTMETFFADAETKLERDAVVASLRRLATRALRRTERTATRVRSEVDRAAEAPRLQRWGEALMRSLDSLRRGTARAQLVDYGPDGAETIEVPLNPALSAQENAKRYFHRAQRFRHGARRSAIRLEELEARCAGLLSALALLDDQGGTFPSPLVGQSPTSLPPPRAPRASSRDEDSVEKARAILEELGIVRVGGDTAHPQQRGRDTGKRPDRWAHHYRTYVASSGDSILVGKNAAGNHRLTFAVARGNDLWLHARDFPGSHVVVPIPRGSEPHPGLLQEAALLAARFSDARAEAAVDVQYTRRKHLRPAGAPGRVYVAGGRTIRVRTDDPRLERLLRSRKDLSS